MEATLTMPAAAPVQKQQGLNQVVINKVRQMVEGRQQDVMGTITRLLEEGKIAQDYIAPIGVSRRNGEQRPVVSFKAAGPGAAFNARRGFQPACQCHLPGFRKDGHPGKIPPRAFGGSRMAETVVRHHPERAFGLDGTDACAGPGGRDRGTGHIVRFLPEAQFGGDPDRIHPGGGKPGGGRFRCLHERYEGLVRDYPAHSHRDPHPQERYGCHLCRGTFLHVRLRKRFGGHAFLPA